MVANGLTDRVLVVGAAAAAADGMAYLVEREVESVVVDEPAPGRVPIRLSDFFRDLEAARVRRIDLLKMDIEGGEYALLDDERFARLDVDTLVMEWHNTTEPPRRPSVVPGASGGAGLLDGPGALDYGRRGRAVGLAGRGARGGRGAGGAAR